MAIYRDLLFIAMVTMSVLQNTTGAQMNNTSSEAASQRVLLKLLIVLPLHTQPYRRMAEGDEGGGHVAEISTLLPRWDRGLEILPAAYVAAEQINSLSELFPRLRIEVVAVNSSVCDNPIGSESSSLATFTKEVTKMRRDGQCLGGVTGLFCEATTSLISSTATSSHFSLLQLSGSASPTFHLQGEKANPLLYQMVASTRTYCNTIYALMKLLSWERIAIVGEMFIQSYYSSTASQCYESFKLNITVSFFGIAASRDNTILEVLANLHVSGSRISLLSTSAKLAAKIICSAYQKGMRWPYYAWIIYDHSPSDLQAHSTACNMETMSLALDGAILLRYELKVSEASGRIEQMVRDYVVTYDNSLREMEAERGLAFGSLQRNEYANILYDSIWAFALAWNSSWVFPYPNPSNQQQNCDVENARKHLDNIAFMGASGVIEFTSNQVATPVILYHYRDTSEVSIGYYYKGNFSVLNQLYLYSQEFPKDEFPRQYIRQFPIPVAVILIAIISFFLLTNSVTLALLLIFRSEPEIKATSPFLSINSFLGIYLMFANPLILVIYQSTVFSEAVRTAACKIVMWCGILGFNFIFATLFVRMFRIFYIFELNKFGRLGKLLSDWSLFAMIVAIVAIPFVILLTWLIVDPYYVREAEIYVPTANPPHYKVFQFCNCKYLRVWLGLLFGECIVLTVAVVILAVKTHRVKIENFKDTKKVSACVFMMVALTCLLVPLWFTLRSSVGKSIIQYVGFAAVAVICQFFLFIPKVYPALLRKILALANRYNINITSWKRNHSSI